LEGAETLIEDAAFIDERASEVLEASSAVR
jgi:hypothetical protein